MSTTTRAAALGPVVDLSREAVLTGGRDHAERWHLLPVGHGQHVVVDQGTGLVLQLDAGSGAVRVREWAGDPAQRWQLHDVRDGLVALVAPCGTGVLTLGESGVGAVAAPYAGRPDQHFALSATTAQLLDLNGDVEEAVTRSGARRMRTSATFLTTERRLLGVTMAWNAMKLDGFEGAVVVLFEDARGNVVGATEPRRVGVPGEWSPGYDRAVSWEQTVPEQPWIPRVTRVRPLHSHAATARFVEMVRRAVAGAEPVADLVERVAGAAPAD